ncbi:hypothetical protein HYS79_00815 [Patescibacteria group bacterium]|nr:hypothetical protein [Patescibacteria group bacterium]
MRLESIPVSTRLGMFSNTEDLANALKKILRGPLVREVPPPLSDLVSTFGSFELVEEGPCSIRVLFTHMEQGGVPFPHSLDAEEMAREIAHYTFEAGYTQQWEVRATCVAGKPAAIVLIPRV